MLLPALQSKAHAGWDVFLRAEIEHYLDRFQAVPVAVPSKDGGTTPVLVHTPYMMGSVTWTEKPEIFERQRLRHRRRLLRVRKARVDAPAVLKAFLQGQFYTSDGKEKAVARGRADAERIRQLLQAAVDEGLVPVPEGKAHLDGHDLRAWLRTYGIGVDCSAFVQHALVHLVRVCHAIAGETPSCRRDYGVGWVRSARVYQEVSEALEDGRFDLVATPGETRPGDVLVRKEHIRIVMDAIRADEGGLILVLAESTSAPDIPADKAKCEADTGPRRYLVKYPTPDRAIQDQLAAGKRVAEVEFGPSEEEKQYLVGRSRHLATFQQERRAPALVVEGLVGRNA